MISFSSSTKLYVAATALEVATFFLLALVTVLQFCFVRRHGDAARAWVKWARYSLALFTFTMFVLCGGLIIATVYSRFTDRHIEFFESEQKGLTQARGFLDSIWMLCEAGVRVLLLATFVSLAAGLATARSTGGTGEVPAGWAKMSLPAWGAGGLTLLLALGLFGVRCYYWAHLFDNAKSQAPSLPGRRAVSDRYGVDAVDLESINRTTSDIDFALDCIWLLLSLLVLGLAGRTRALSRSAPHTRPASNYFLACAVLFVAQPLYNIIILIMFYLNSSYMPGVDATIVTDVLFRTWPYAAILLIMFVLGRKKIGGVWSKQQSFLTKETAAGETVYQTPWGYQVTHKIAPQQAPAYSAQEQLDNYYAQPQQDIQYHQQQHHHQQQYQQQQYQQQQYQQQQYQQQQPH